ncbi:hypothetical protein F4553_005384 [Allocatelliglobosispora scoriae]|uniref:Uncharacterized protein n=1 Tax=Allocatelliglobosispora scoriae TaxID=643052 RepID=A0A841BWF5_9ACTN|nr:hypothetical protein [Allocatelliglobosispora scoriae]
MCNDCDLYDDPDYHDRDDWCDECGARDEYQCECP